MRKTKFTKLLCLVLSLVMILGAVPFTGITAFAADELTETISLVGGSNSVSGTHFNASASGCDSKLGLKVSDSSSLVISARKDETITKVVLGYSLVYKCTSSDKGTFDGDATFSDINDKEITIYNNSYAVGYVNSVTVYYLGDSSKPSVTVTGGANADVSGGWTTQQYLPGAMDTLVYTAMTGASFKAFEPYTKDGITVERISSTEVTVSGTPTGNTQITVPDAVTKGKIITYTGEEFKEVGSRLSRFGSYTDRNTGLTFSTTGDSHSVNIRSNRLNIDNGASLVFSTSEGKIASITIYAGDILRLNDSNWTSADGKVTWSGTPSESVTLSGMCSIDGFTGMTIFIKLPHVHSFAEDWSSDENGHWHACTEEDCDIEDYATSTVDGVAYGTHTWKNGVCTVCGLTKIAAPQAITGLVYNGEEQTGVMTGEGYTVTNGKATEAGDYTAIATLNDGYVWDDCTLTPKEIEWKILTVTDYHILNETCDSFEGKGGKMGHQDKIGAEGVGRTIICLTEEQLAGIGDYVTVVGGDLKKETTVTLDCAYTYFYAGDTKYEAKDMGYAAFLIIDCDAAKEAISGYGYYAVFNGESTDSADLIVDALYAKPNN